MKGSETIKETLHKADWILTWHRAQIFICALSLCYGIYFRNYSCELIYRNPDTADLYYSGLSCLRK